MKVKILITQPRGKEHLVEVFEKAGAEVLSPLAPYVQPDLIIPTVDEELPTLAYLKERLPIVISSPFTISVCRDKAEFYRFCRRHGFLTPHTMQENVIVKPRFGKASKGIMKVDRSYIVQEDLSRFPEISIDYFADHESKCISIIPRYRKNVINGESTDFSLVENFNFHEVKRLGEELQLIGHNVIQGFWDGKEVYFTEINCRFGGGSWMTFPIFNSCAWLVENYAKFHSQRGNDTLHSGIS